MNSKLTYASLPIEIKNIANESLGLGVLRSLFSYSYTYHLIMKIDDGIFVGFALYHFQKTRGEKPYVTGIIDAVCVSKAYRKEGFGTLLTFGTLRKMSAYGVDRVELMLKAPSADDHDGEPGFPFMGDEQLLLMLGFRKLKVYNNYFRSISKKFGYDCIMCGDKPDTCNAILYSINDKDDVKISKESVNSSESNE